MRYIRVGLTLHSSLDSDLARISGLFIRMTVFCWTILHGISRRFTLFDVVCVGRLLSLVHGSELGKSCQ